MELPRYGRNACKTAQTQRLWLADDSCERLGPAHGNHVWSDDFVAHRTAGIRAVGMLTLIDEHARECLAIDVVRKHDSEDVLERLRKPFVRRNTPACMRGDIGPEFTAFKVRQGLTQVGVTTWFIEPGGPCYNGFCESLDGRLRVSCWPGRSSARYGEVQGLIER